MIDTVVARMRVLNIQGLSRVLLIAVLGLLGSFLLTAMHAQPAAAGERVQVRVDTPNGKGVNVRSTPDTRFDPLYGLADGTPLNAVARVRTANTTVWVQLADGGFISADFVAGDPVLPEREAPPADRPTRPAKPVPAPEPRSETKSMPAGERVQIWVDTPNGRGVNVRSTPDTRFDPLYGLANGTALNAVARVRNPADSKVWVLLADGGYISADFVAGDPALPERKAPQQPKPEPKDEPASTTDAEDRVSEILDEELDTETKCRIDPEKYGCVLITVEGEDPEESGAWNFTKKWGGKTLGFAWGVTKEVTPINDTKKCFSHDGSKSDCAWMMSSAFPGGRWAGKGGKFGWDLLKGGEEVAEHADDAKRAAEAAAKASADKKAQEAAAAAATERVTTERLNSLTWANPKTFDSQGLRGATAEAIEKAVPSSWVRAQSKDGGGVLYRDPDNRGRQIRLMPGYLAGNRPDPLTHGPYAVVSQGGNTMKIPLAGNPTL